MVLGSKKFPSKTPARAMFGRSLIYLQVLSVGLNIPLSPAYPLFCVDLDPRWTPESGICKRRKNGWSSMVFRCFAGLRSAGVSRRFGPPIRGKGGVK